MAKFKKMTPVYIRFWDHAKWTGSNSEALTCEVVGIYYDEDDVCYKIASWVCNGEIEENAEQFAIVKSAVVHIQPLKFTRRTHDSERKIGNNN
jgi:hypothetical protein